MLEMAKRYDDEPTSSGSRLYPANAIEALARSLYPVICSYFESEEGSRE